MAKGQEAKDRVVAVLKETFGSSFIGEIDKKIYIWSEENGAPQQVAISMTCPKTPVGDNEPAVVTRAINTPEMTQEENDTIMELMCRLNL